MGTLIDCGAQLHWRDALNEEMAWLKPDFVWGGIVQSPTDCTSSSLAVVKLMKADMAWGAKACKVL